MYQGRNATKRPSDETTIQEETFPAAEKILSDIENVIKKDPELTSFEIIPIQDNENKCPVYHEEHSLGLASWCVQPLYCYTYGRLIDLRRSEHPPRREEPTTISRWSMGALLLNPDVRSFWNMRRELVRTGRLEALGELRFAAIVLCHKAKCSEAFAYRRWLLRHLLLVGGAPDASDNPRERIENLLLNEIAVAAISADRYANNYHAWSHREYVLSHCQKTLADFYPCLMKNEWVSCGEWCNRHVSDHSGLAYRQFLLNRLLHEERTIETPSRGQLAERREFIKRLVASLPSKDPSEKAGGGDGDDDVDVESWRYLNILHGGSQAPRRAELDYDRVLVALSYWAEDCKSNERDILSYPGHEALWYHRRFLGHALLRLDACYAREGAYGGFHRDDEVRPSGDSTPREPGLLSLAFCSDNERIVRVSRDSKHPSQMALAEKFVKYIGEFFRDRTCTRER